MLTKAILVAAMLISTLVLPEFAHAQDTIRVTLVGTGTPTARPDRLGPATLVEVPIKSSCLMRDEAYRSGSDSCAFRWQRSMCFSSRITTPSM
jgi:hypothetical protein